MSEIIGKKLICDRCNAEIFLKHVKDEPLDGGFSKLSRFEEKPDGWGWLEYKDLCPNCFSKWNKIVDNFLNDKKEQMEYCEESEKAVLAFPDLEISDSDIERMKKIVKESKERELIIC